jgi:hypothetical protein
VTSNQAGNLRLQAVRRAFASDADFEPSVFIAYYHADTQTFTQHIQTWLALRYGARNVVTTADIPPFVGSAGYYLHQKIESCDLVLVIIGPQWESAGRNAPREAEYLRTAVRIALENNRPLALVCVEGAELPRLIDLPFDMRPMLQAPIVSLNSIRRFGGDLQQLLDQLKPAEPVAQPTLSDQQFEGLYEQFMQSYRAADWNAARAYLQQIYMLDVAGRTFRLQLGQYMRQVEYHIRYEEARPFYAQLEQIAASDPARAWEALQTFLAEYPEFGDPAQLAQKLQPVDPEVLKLLHTATDPQVPVERRRDAGRQLGLKGDPRPGTGLRLDGTPEIDWIRIPEGEFIYHYDRKTTLPTYYIARYPVTHSQFQAFVEDGGYENDEWWQGSAKRERFPNPQVWAFPNHPRERSSWYDAVAFCRWLSARLGYQVRLPTEAEWEKAARGTSGRIYPWGDRYIVGYANINETTSSVVGTNLREPTPVGIYPQGASKYGVLDLIGNVWEWCLNVENDLNRIDLEVDALRALRGGSWISEWMFAHTVRRRVQRPDSRFPDFGFRLACSSIPLITSTGEMQVVLDPDLS